MIDVPPSFRKAASKLEIGHQVNISLAVISATVLHKDVTGETCTLRLGGIEMKNHYSTNVDGQSVEHDGEVAIECTAEGSVELVVTTGASQRLICRGLNDQDRKKLATASPEQLVDVVSDRSEEERSAVLRQLLTTLSKTERDELFSSTSTKS